jgi:hypothetical protein
MGEKSVRYMQLEALASLNRCGIRYTKQSVKREVRVWGWGVQVLQTISTPVRVMKIGDGHSKPLTLQTREVEN